MSRGEFKKWIVGGHHKTKPFADYKSVKAERARREAAEAAPVQETAPQAVSVAETPVVETTTAEMPETAIPFAEKNIRTSEKYSELEGNNELIPEGKRRYLSPDEIDDVLDALDEVAVEKEEVPYSKEEWDKFFKNPIQSPAGLVRMGVHQFGKLHPDGNSKHQDRRTWIALIYKTLTEPNLIAEQFNPEEDNERDYKYVFIKSFISSSGKKTTYFASVTVKKMRNGGGNYQPFQET